MEKYPIVCLFLPFLLFSSCKISPTVELSGVEETRTYTLEETYDRIEVSSYCEVHLVPASFDSVSLNLDSALIPYMRVETDNRTLKICMKEPVRLENGAPRIQAVVYHKNRLKGLEVSGASILRADSLLETDDLEMDFSGASAFVGNIRLGGNLDLQFSGASSLEGRMTVAGTTFMDFSGASTMEAECVLAGDSRVGFTGASTVEWSGFAKKLDAELSGASSVRGYEMAVDVLHAVLSGASVMEITVNHELEADCSGASSLIYKGQPKVESQVSGASTVAPAR